MNETSVPDEDRLIEAAQGGDPDAFMQLIQAHDGPLRGLAFAMTGNAATMDDVLQEAYLKAFRSIRSFRAQSSFKTWLWRIVHNTATDESRRSSRLTLVPDPVEETTPGSGISERTAVKIDVDDALSRLPETQRAVVLLIDGEGFDYATAGEILGISAGTVSSRIHPARVALRRMLASSIKDER